MGVLSTSIASDASSLMAGCMDGVYRLDLKSNDYRKLYAHDSYVSSSVWLADSDLLISAGYVGVLCLYDFKNDREIRRQKVHQFWSWDMAVSPDTKLIASVTGQYLAGGYKYEPKPESEPSVKIMLRESGEVLHELSHVPSVQSVAFSSDSKFVAAGNLMGEVRVWDCKSGEPLATFTTPDFTSWGIIKSHCYLGGIFAMHFAPGDKELIVAGMGEMHDPMAGNGRQLWQRWTLGLDGENTDLGKTAPKKIAETNKSEAGEGLMETLAIHPDGKRFVMGGRLRGGEWNVAMFEIESGKRIGTLKTGYRVTEAGFSAAGDQLVLVGAQGQPKLKDGKFTKFGRVEKYAVE
jgi:WD40 repeat protein